MFSVKSVVCDYGIYEDGQLKLICNNHLNALLIKAILEKDDRFSNGFNGNPEFTKEDIEQFYNKHHR